MYFPMPFLQCSLHIEEFGPFGCFNSNFSTLQDEICRSISSKGGIDVILQCIDDSSVYNNKAVAKACCSLLSKVRLN